MTIADLIKAAQETEIRPAEVQALKERLQKAEEQFQKEDEARAITQAWLDRTYTL